VKVLNPAGWEVKDGNAVIDTQVNAMWDGMVKAVGISSEQAHAAILGTVVMAPYAMMSAAAERAMQDHLNALAAGGDATASTSVRAEGVSPVAISSSPETHMSANSTPAAAVVLRSVTPPSNRW